MVTVADFASHLSGTFAEVNTDEARFGRGDAVLEGILYEGDEDERSYFRAAVRSDVDLCFDGDIGGQTDTHQFDVVADEVHLFVKGDETLLIVIEHMAEETA